MGHQYMGVGASYCELLRRRTPCPVCSVELTSGSMTAHRRMMHGTETEIDWNRLPFSQTEYLSQAYYTRFPKGTTQCPCPLHVLPGSYWTCNGLRNHFNQQHWVDSIIILEDNPSPFPKCYCCVIQVPHWRLNSCHYKLENFWLREAIRIQRKTLQH